MQHSHARSDILKRDRALGQLRKLPELEGSEPQVRVDILARREASLIMLQSAANDLLAKEPGKNQRAMLARLARFPQMPWLTWETFPYPSFSEQNRRFALGTMISLLTAPVGAFFASALYVHFRLLSNERAGFPPPSHPLLPILLGAVAGIIIAPLIGLAVHAIGRTRELSALAKKADAEEKLFRLQIRSVEKDLAALKTACEEAITLAGRGIEKTS